MSLISPYTSAYGNIAQTNLSSVLNATKKEELVTNVAEKAFQDYQKNKFGLGHHIKKFTLSVAGGGVVLGTPVAAGIGGMYWLLKDYIKDYTKLTQITPMPIKGVLSIGGAIAVDACFYKTIGVAPIKTTIGWSIGMISMGIVNAANFAQNMIAGSFLQKEKAMIKTRDEMHQLIINDLKTTYDHMAEGFSQHINSAIDSPKELLKLRAMAEQIEDQLPYVQKQLEKFELRKADVNSILNKLSSVAAYAQNYALDLRVPKTEGDIRFNIELMSVLSEDEFASKAVSTEVKSHIKSAKSNKLGVLHTLKSLGKAGLKGSAVTLATGLVIPTIFAVGALLSKNSSCLITRSFEACTLEGKAALASIPVVVLAGGIKADQVLKSCFAERRKMDQRVSENNRLASEKMHSIYTGIADQLVKEFSYGASFETMQNAEKILRKLPAIKNEIAKSGIQNPESITEYLEYVLNQILSKRVFVPQ